MILGADPVAASVLTSAGAWGADICVGEGQPFGTPLAFGGPYLGLFACSDSQLRRLPGRLVGETLDTEGRKAYVTTLRAESRTFVAKRRRRMSARIRR
jgi:glycine dehydrogenase subunit 1